MQIPVLNGVYTDSESSEFRIGYPRNYVPVIQQQGISGGYLRPYDGVRQMGTGQGAGRGGIVWNGVQYRVSGTSLISIDETGAVTVLGDVGTGGPVTMDYSFDRLAVASGGRLYYWNGKLTQVVDADLGFVRSMVYIAGYFMTTDGQYIVVTDLTDPTSVTTTKYGSSEADPDPVMAVSEFRGEAYAFNRYTIEVFENVGGSNFPFQVVKGAQVTKGIVGPLAFTFLGNTFAFVGSGRNESLGVYTMTYGDVKKISTREIDTILEGYTEGQLFDMVMECRVDRNHQLVMLHLPDRCLVFDTVGSQMAGELIWFSLDSGVTTPAQYRARGLIRFNNQWWVDDPTSSAFGVLDDTISSHYGNLIGWQFGTLVIYGEGNDGIVHEIELVTLPGRVALGDEPVVSMSHSHDGVKWSAMRTKSCGKLGERTKRLAWRTDGTIRQWRVQRFQGTSDSHLGIARVEAQIEPLQTRPGSGG